jgi:hypothetical protein
MGFLLSCGTENKPTYKVTTTVSPSEGGTITLSPSGGVYSEGETVTITGTPSTGWRFVRWEGDWSGETNPSTLNMTKDYSVIGIFEKKNYPLTINIEGEGEVTERVIQQKSTEYPYQTVVELTPVPDNGWRFVEWSGDLSGSEVPKTITVDGEKTVNVKFERKNYPLTVTVVGEGTVTETVLPQKTTEYPFQTVVQLTPVPSEGWEFVEWGGDLSGSTIPLEVTIIKVLNVVGVFGRKDYPLNITVEGEGSVIEEVIQAKHSHYPYGTVVRLTSIPAKDWKFVGWEGDLVGNENPVSITIDREKTVTAVFEDIPIEACRYILEDASAVFSPNDFCEQNGMNMIRIVVPARPGSSGALIAVSADIPSFDHTQGIGEQDAIFTVKASTTSNTTVGTLRSKPEIQHIPTRQLPSGYQAEPTGVPQTRTFCNSDWCVEAALKYNSGPWAFYEDINLAENAKADTSFYSGVIQKMQNSDSLLFELFGEMTDVDGDRSIAVLATDKVSPGTFFWEDAFGPGPPESSGSRRSTFERMVTFGPGLLISSSGTAYATAYWSTNVTAEAAEILTNTHAARLGIKVDGCCWIGGYSNYVSHLGNGSSYLIPYIATDGVPDGGLQSFWKRSCFSGSTPFDCSLRNDIYFGSGAFWYWLYQRFGPGIVANYMDERWLQNSGDRLEWSTGTPESVLYPQFLLSLALDGTDAGAEAELHFPNTSIQTRLPGITELLPTLAIGSSKTGTVAYARSWVREVSSTMSIELEVQWLANRNLHIVVAKQ